jgi:hypothetical protein
MAKATAGDYNFRISSMSGIEILKGRFVMTGVPGVQNISIDRQLAKGMYILHISNEANQFTKILEVH